MPPRRLALDIEALYEILHCEVLMLPAVLALVPRRS